MTTLLRQGQVAQEWLLTNYLTAWLELVGGTVDCDYPLAKAYRVQLRALARMAEHLSASDPGSQQIVELHHIEAMLQSTLRSMGGYPAERDMQWGIWARDVPLSVAYGFGETEFLDPTICHGIAPCCMYAAFLVSQVVTDAGVAEEIAQKMFEEKPRALVEIMRSLPVSRPRLRYPVSDPHLGAHDQTARDRRYGRQVEHELCPDRHSRAPHHRG